VRLPALALALALTGCADPAGSDAPECSLSAVGEATYQAAVAAHQADSSIPAEAILTYANQPGDALLDGGEIFLALADLIAKAERTVDVAMFVWEVDSDASREIFSALESLSASHRGGDPLQVRLLVDDIAVTGAGPETAEAMLAELASRPIDPRAVSVQVAVRRHTAFGAMHEKLAIVDDRVAHLGGANVEAIHDWTAELPPWRDSAYVVRGEVARSLSMAFAALWDSSELWSCTSGGCAAAPAPLTAEHPAPPESPESEPVDGCVPMIALNRRPAGVINNSTDSAMARGYLAAMGAAETSIEIQTPNLNDDAARAAVLEAVGRGVDVGIILSRDFNEEAANAPGQGGGNRENADRLYAEATIAFGAEAACRHLDIRWFARLGDGVVDGGVVDGNGAGASHLKYMQLDRQLTIVGSANMDTQSWNNSGETVVAVDDAATAARWDARIFAPSFAIAEPTGHCGE
jgi:phosphatidylserine/phosphatidylglycerophosphate/cardiolipin synthase-like enzyme